MKLPKKTVGSCYAVALGSKVILDLFLLGGAFAVALPWAVRAQDTQTQWSPSASSRADMEYRSLQRSQPAYQQPPRQIGRQYVVTPSGAIYQQQPKTPVAAPGQAVRVAYDDPMSSSAVPVPDGYLPPGVGVNPEEIPAGPITTPGAVLAPRMMADGMGMGGSCGCDSCGVGCGGDSCGGSCAQGGDVWGNCCCCDIFGALNSLLWVPYLSLEAGAHAFRSPLDGGINANFGTQQGVTLAGPIGRLFNIPELQEIGYHVGVLATQSNFSGQPDSQDQTVIQKLFDHNIGRDQLFFTAGLFHRAMCGGFQWDVAFDYLHDTRVADMDMKQVRAELSYSFAGRSEIGFWGAFSGDQRKSVFGSLFDTTTGATTSLMAELQPMNIYAAFYRQYFAGGGDYRVWGGATEKGDGLIGTDVRVPLGNSLALEHSILYMIPTNGTRTFDVGNTPVSAGVRSQERETWSIMVNLVWYPGQSSHNIEQNPYRPLLNTASNSSFIVDTK